MPCQIAVDFQRLVHAGKQETLAGAAVRFKLDGARARQALHHPRQLLMDGDELEPMRGDRAETHAASRAWPE